MHRNLDQLKKRTISAFKRIAKEEKWEYNLEKLNSWSPWRYQRSLYFNIITKEGERGFFKYNVSNSSKANFLREINYLQYINGKHPNISPKIISFSNKKYWSLVEELDMNKGYICEGEDTSKIKKQWINWIFKPLKEINRDVEKTKEKEKLWRYSFHNKNEDNYKFCKEQIQKRLRHFKKNKSIFPTEFPHKEISNLLENMDKLKIKKENKVQIAHGDFAPNNIYFSRKDKKVKIIDWEWAFLTRNKKIHGSFDFSRMFLRFWRNKPLQKEILKKYLKENSDLDQLKFGIVLEATDQIRQFAFKEYNFRKKEYLNNHLKSHFKTIEDIINL